MEQEIETTVIEDDVYEEKTHNILFTFGYILLGFLLGLLAGWLFI